MNSENYRKQKQINKQSPQKRFNQMSSSLEREIPSEYNNRQQKNRKNSQKICQNKMSQLSTLYDEIIGELNPQQQENIPHYLLKKFARCLQLALFSQTENPEHFLLNISVCLNLWKTATQMNIDLKVLNKFLPQNKQKKLELNNYAELLKFALPSLSVQFDNVMKNIEEEAKDKRKSVEMIIKKISNRYFLYTIMCIKELYQADIWHEGYELGIQTINLIKITKSDSKLKFQLNVHVKFKLLYLMQKITHKMKKFEEELIYVKECLKMLETEPLEIHKTNQQEKKDVLMEKLMQRKGELQKNIAQAKTTKKKSSKIRISSLHNSNSKFSKSNGIVKQNKSNILTQENFKKKSMSLHKFYKNCDEEKTRKNTFFQNNNVSNPKLNKSLRKTDKIKPVNKYNIKINKISKKTINSQNMKNHNFVNTLNTVLKQDLEKDDFRKSKQLKNYLDLMLARPNQAKNLCVLEKEDELSDQEKLNNEESAQKMSRQHQISSYQGILNSYDYNTSSAGSYFNLSAKNNLAEQKNIQTVNNIQKEILIKFINGYEKINTKQNDYNMSDSSFDDNDLKEEYKANCSSVKLAVENICGPREPRMRKQKIFHTIDEVLIPNVLIPQIGFVEQIKAGVSKSTKNYISERAMRVSVSDSYVFHVKIMSSICGAMYGERKLDEINGEHGISLEEQLMNLANISPLCFTQKAELTTNICGYALEYLLLSFMKRFFSSSKGKVGRVLVSQKQIIPTRSGKIFDYISRYIRVKIFQQNQQAYKKIYEQSLGNQCVDLVSSYNPRIERSNDVKQLAINSESLKFKTVQKFHKNQIKFDFGISVKNKTENSLKQYESQLCLLGEELYLPALIYQICTQTSFNFREMQPKIHADIISCFFMTKQPTFMLSSFFRSMKFILMTQNQKKDEIIKLYYQQQNYSFIFRLNNNRQYIVKLSYFKAKPLYFTQNFFFIRLEFQQKQHKIRKNKLLLTSRDLEDWICKNKEFVFYLTQSSSKELLYEVVRSMIHKIQLRKTINSVKLGIFQKAEKSSKSLTVSDAYYYRNNFKIGKVQKSNDFSFLSPFLQNVQVLYQKLIKIKCLNSYGIVSVLNVTSSTFYDFFIYIPSTQNYIGFSLPLHILQNKEQQQNKQHINWSNIIRLIEFSIKPFKEKTYFVAKIMGHQTFIQQNLHFQYFQVANRVFKIVINIQQNKAPLNFQSSLKTFKKRTVDRVSKKEKPKREPFYKMYSSESKKYIIYLSLIDAYTGQTLHFSYYLKQLLALILNSKENEFAKKKQKKNISQEELFNEEIIRYSNLLTVFSILVSSCIRELNKNAQKYNIGESSNLQDEENYNIKGTGFTQQQNNKIQDLFTSVQLQNQLRSSIQKHIFNDSTINNKKSSKINLNAPISFLNSKQKSIFYLYKHLQCLKKNIPVCCIIYNSQSRNFLICIDNYREGSLKRLQISPDENPFAHIEIITRNRNVLLGSRNRLAKFWRNRIIIA